jgi:antitoxin (DNA-binding transcriptional repressor) of toxin-antitoxin stability system
MKTATVLDLRNDFGRVSKWLEAGETVQIIKRGKPFARVIPEPKKKSFLGATPSNIPLPDDIDDPPPVTWEAGE